MLILDAANPELDSVESINKYQTENALHDTSTSTSLVVSMTS